MQARLQNHLAEYTHNSLLVNSARHKAMLNNNENLCFSYLEYYPDLPTLAHDKEGIYLRSLPWSPHPVLELLMKKSFADSHLKTKNAVKLETVLQNKDLVLGLPGKRWKGQISELIKIREEPPLRLELFSRFWQHISNDFERQSQLHHSLPIMDKLLGKLISSAKWHHYFFACGRDELSLYSCGGWL